MTRKKSFSGTTKQLIKTIVDGMQEVKAVDITVMDLRTVSNAMTDFFIICHGNSAPQVQAIAQSVEKEAEVNLGDKPWHIEGMRNAKWVLMDYVNVVVHIFEAEARTFYALEELWADADTEHIK